MARLLGYGLSVGACWYVVKGAAFLWTLPLQRVAEVLEMLAHSIR